MRVLTQITVTTVTDARFAGHFGSPGGDAVTRYAECEISVNRHYVRPDAGL